LLIFSVPRCLTLDVVSQIDQHPPHPPRAQRVETRERNPAPSFQNFHADEDVKAFAKRHFVS
jgi:hypothetical protein